MSAEMSPPTMTERAEAARAARALRAALDDPSLRGTMSVMHLDCRRPRRALWIVSWEGIPGFCRTNGKIYSHSLLPGWEYTASEVRREMIPDLELLAEKGQRPATATSGTEAA